MNGSAQRERCFYIDNKDFFSIIKQLVDPSFSLLDVGCGPCFSLGHFACRVIVGVEIHRPYLEARVNGGPHIIPIHADAADIGKLFMPKSFSAVLFLDTIEHFTKKDGLRLLDAAEELAAEKVVVFTPRGFFPQKNYDYYNLEGEKYQEHRSGWEPEDFLSRGYYVLVLKGLHDRWNPSFVRSYGADHPPVDALIAYKIMPEHR